VAVWSQANSPIQMRAERRGRAALVPKSSTHIAGL